MLSARLTNSCSANLMSRRLLKAPSPRMCYSFLHRQNSIWRMHFNLICHPSAGRLSPSTPCRRILTRENILIKYIRTESLARWQKRIHQLMLWCSAAAASQKRSQVASRDYLFFILWWGSRFDISSSHADAILRGAALVSEHISAALDNVNFRLCYMECSQFKRPRHHRSQYIFIFCIMILFSRQILQGAMLHVIL